MPAQDYHLYATPCQVFSTFPPSSACVPLYFQVRRERLLFVCCRPSQLQQSTMVLFFPILFSALSLHSLPPMLSYLQLLPSQGTMMYQMHFSHNRLPAFLF